MRSSINYLRLIALASVFGIIILNNFDVNNVSESGLMSVLLIIIELVVFGLLLQTFQWVRIENDKISINKLIGKSAEIGFNDIIGFKINYTKSRLIRELEIRTEGERSFFLNYFGTNKFEEIESYFLKKFNLLKIGYTSTSPIEKEEFLKIKRKLDRSIRRNAKNFNLLIIMILILVLVDSLGNMKGDIYEQLKFALAIIGGTCLITLLVK